MINSNNIKLLNLCKFIRK